jgi:uncharacterized membrane protein
MNMEIATLIKNTIEDWLEHVFISYTSNKKIENQIDHRFKMLLIVKRNMVLLSNGLYYYATVCCEARPSIASLKMELTRELGCVWFNCRFLKI